jgi:predicted DNA-binding transcriptional regulator AlpA
MTQDDLERELGLKRATQGTLRSRGQIPFYRLGGGRIIRYRRSEIEAWIAAGAARAQ